MFIKSLSFHDQLRNWRLEEMSFNRLTLLVGASGVGKTQILSAISRLRLVAQGESINGLKWRTEFVTSDDRTYQWEGEFETRPFEREEARLGSIPTRFRKPENIPRIVCERLFVDNELVVDRDSERILFQGKETVKLHREKSVVHLLPEPLISPAFDGFKGVFVHDLWRYHLSEYGIPSPLHQSHRYRSVDEIRKSDLGPLMKLYFASTNAPAVFEAIRDSFVNIFPFVEDIKWANVSEADQDVCGVNPAENYLPDGPILTIKEKRVGEWIYPWAISSGMKSTLLHLCELHLCANGTVILVDEFENSLGINCLDEVTNQLLNSTRDLQFIITSHHPYIINNIPSSSWKLVTRRGGVVRVLDAEELNLPKSKHDAFTQLINQDAYVEGPET